MSRDEQVLALLQSPWRTLTPAVCARYLNLDGRCDWCPVGPPREGRVCATVPPASARRAARVLDRLVRAGSATKVWPGTRHAHYTRYNPAGGD